MQVINKMRKNKNQNVPPTIVMKDLSCFGSSKFSLSLSIDGLSNEIRRGEIKDQIHVLYIGILPSRMHLVAIITH